MPSEKEKSVLKSSDYDIKGNTFRAFYDKSGKLVFVLDSTLTESKPNVLLVLSSYGNRKWDDVLSNDYGVDLELIRPKKDNKYQKLDIEYEGLVVYDNLIRASQENGDVDAAIHDLSDFRAISGRRSATERLTVANAIAEKTRETIERAETVITDLEKKIKSGRTKLTELRRNVGKEPTKQSAAKILKTEAQIDVFTGKLERAKKRLENAKKRLLSAEEDITVAQHILDIIPNIDENTKFKTVENLTPAIIPNNELVPVPDSGDSDKDDNSDTDDDDIWTDDTDYDDVADEKENNGTDSKSDEEIKPLFDKDPNILDEKIAFKPISFDETFSTPQESDTVIENNEVDNTVVSEGKEPDNLVVQKNDIGSDDIQDMSFTPPKPIMDVVQVPENYSESDDIKLDDVFSDDFNADIKYESDTNQENTSPVLDSLTSVDSDEDTVTDGTNDSENDVVDISENGDDVNIMTHEQSETALDDSDESETIVDAVISEKPLVAPVPTASARTENLVRPAPISKAQPGIINVPKPEQTHHKPGLLYYVFLLVLIALSVFTLWLYQRSNVSQDAVPELGVTTTSVPEVNTPEPDVVVPDDDNPFIDITDVKPTEAVTIGEVVEESLDKIAKVSQEKPQPVITPDVEVDIEPESYDALTMDSDQEELESKNIDTNVNKPAYNVTQDKVFTPETDDSNLCQGGISPDKNGCCPGETYTDMGDAGFNCCPNDGGDCFPPMF